MFINKEIDHLNKLNVCVSNLNKGIHQEKLNQNICSIKLDFWMFNFPWAGLYGPAVLEPLHLHGVVAHGLQSGLEVGEAALLHLRLVLVHKSMIQSVWILKTTTKEKKLSRFMKVN